MGFIYCIPRTAGTLPYMKVIARFTSTKIEFFDSLMVLYTYWKRQSYLGSAKILYPRNKR